MKYALLILAVLFPLCARGDTPDISLPAADIALIRTADFVEVTGTNVGGGEENFSVHNWKAIKQFVDLLTSARYFTAPKSLDPQFKSKARYHVRMSSHGQVVFELQIVADTVLDIPNDPLFYVQSDRHSDVLLGPLLKLR